MYVLKLGQHSLQHSFPATSYAMEIITDWLCHLATNAYKLDFGLFVKIYPIFLFYILQFKPRGQFHEQT